MDEADAAGPPGCQNRSGPMSLRPFDELPDSARLWIFGADRRPAPRQTARILERMRGFLQSWTAHREELAAGLDWRRHRFLLVAVDESRTAASGCSIDELMRCLGELEDETGVGLTDGAAVWFRDPRDGDRVASVSRGEFRELARAGVVGPDTTVYDLTVDRMSGLRAGRWELPASESWHASLLSESAPEAPAGSGS